MFRNLLVAIALIALVGFSGCLTKPVAMLETATTEGYQIYPVPAKLAIENGSVSTVGEDFSWDEATYSQDADYPATEAVLGDSYIFRSELKQQVVFYPLAFNPVTGKITHYTRIRVRIDYVPNTLARVEAKKPVPWKPPVKNTKLNNIPPAGMMASVFGAPPAPSPGCC